MANYDGMTHAELLAENQRLQTIRDEAKAAQMELVPYLDAYSKAEEALAASFADPALAQGISGDAVSADLVLRELLLGMVKQYMEGKT